MLQYLAVETIGKRIKTLRKKRGWSQEQLLIQVRRQLGDSRVLHRVTLSRIENDHQSPSEKLLPVLAQVLGTTTDYLLGLTDDPRPRRNTVREAPAHYAISAEDAALLAWLEAENPKLAELYRTVLELPEDLQERFVDMLEEQIRLLQDLGRLREEKEEEQKQEES